MSKAPTLFDFDDFFSEEASKGKSAAKEKMRTEPPEKQDKEHKAAETGDLSAEGVAEQEPVAAAEPPITAPSDPLEEQYIKPRLELPEQEAHSDPLTEDDGEPDKPILEELAAEVPSAASKYPFDPASFEVIDKEKTARQKTAAEPSKDTEAAAEGNMEKGEQARSLPEWDLDKTYYSIGEVAHLFGVNISHIRFWTTEFKMKPRTTRKGDRLYTPDQIAQLRLIYHLVKVKKHTLKGAREILRTGKGSVASHLDLKESLTRLRDMLLEIKENL